MKTEKRKAYERPRMEVVELQNTTQLLEGSNRSDLNVEYEEEDI